MTGEIRTAVYPAPPLDMRAVLRYAGAKAADGAVSAILDECVSLAKEELLYRVAYAVYPVSVREDEVSLGFCIARSHSLAERLTGCQEALVFCATVGHGIDRLAERAAVMSPAKALLLGALGTERVEALADLFCLELAEKYAREGRVLRSRFSPGYGDLPLSLQKDIFSVLDLPRKIGVSLSESLLMTPKKSVTAIVGIAAKE